MRNSTQRLCVALVLIGAFAAIHAQQPETSAKSRIEEQVRVRLVILDIMVLDRDGRTVPDLAKEDFVLVRDFERIPVDTLDLICPDGVTDDVRAVESPDRRERRPLTGESRRIVLAIDYQHFRQIERVDILERVKAMVEHGVTADDEIMVAALTGGLRIEQVYTRDRQQVLATLDRMMYDITLWRDPFPHVSEHEFFDALTALIDVQVSLEGPKALVLFSNITMNHRRYDASFERVASAAVNARTAVYPVHAVGLPQWRHWRREPSLDLHPLDSPPLARLAVETGGRFTENTNDLSLGLARAQRDLGCRYALGFYDDDLRTDKAHRVKLQVKRRGLRLINPEVYRSRSPEQQRELLLRSAWIAPGMFRSDVVRAHFFALGPADPQHWDGLIAINFPVTVDPQDGPDEVREFGAVLERSNTVIHRFDRSVTLHGTGGTKRRDHDVSFVEPVKLRPGDYTLRVLLSDPAKAEPHSFVTRFVLPKVPRGEPLLVGPILGRRAGGNMLVRSADGEVLNGAEGDDFLPLLVQQVDGSGPLVMLTQVCFVGKYGGDPDSTIARTLERVGGGAVQSFDSVAVELAGPEPVRCQTILDDLPVDGLAGGSYVFKTSLDAGGESLEGELRLAVESAASAPAPPP